MTSMAVSVHPLLRLSVLVAVTAASLTIDKSATGKQYDGLGGLSGGGATTRLLIDYPEESRNQVLDYLFKPNFGASLQILKVEIGGDSQSTDGTESSHMHTADDLDYKRGYEWWLMSEAKSRNPDIKLYGLPWAYPGWVGGPEQSGSPFTHPDLTSKYILKWLQGARSVYNLEIDFIGIWNERASDATYAKTLRAELDNNGFQNTTLVAKDGGADICNDMAADKDYAAAIGVIGLHYPSDFSNYDVCHSLNKPIWASEESSSYDDLNGAACWGRVVTSHYVLNEMTASIMWNLVGSYFHGTNWYASSMLTAVQPWSGYYEPEMPVVWATAHITQFTKIGWKYLVNNSGSGVLPGGGYYATIVDDNGSDMTLTIAKISRDHASCTRPHLPDFDVHSENVTFVIKGATAGTKLYVWYSNYEAATPTLFKSLSPITVGADGSISLFVDVGDFYTVTTVATGTKGSFPEVAKTVPQFPLPYKDTFESYNESQEPHYFSDQIGAWEVHPSLDNSGNKVFRQMVSEKPIGWSDHGSNGPMTLIGQLELADLTVSAKFYIPPSVAKNESACVGNRADQMWHTGVILCIAPSGSWVLSYGGPALGGVYQKNNIVAQGNGPSFPVGTWQTLQLTTEAGEASGKLADTALFSNQTIRYVDSGFSVIGMSSWNPIEFDDIVMSKAGEEQGLWSAPVPGVTTAGTPVAVKNCTANGVVDSTQNFFLQSDWALVHVASGLCVEASGAADGASLMLNTCSHGKVEQEFRNDYTRIRNGAFPITLGAYERLSQTLTLVGSTNGTASLSSKSSGGLGEWTKWTFYPNTGQLRNQYGVTNLLYGYPSCLTAMA